MYHLHTNLVHIKFITHNVKVSSYFQVYNWHSVLCKQCVYIKQTRRREKKTKT